MPIKKGDKIKVEYTGTLEDGKVFDTSEGKPPLEFEVGAGKIIKGFDDAVIGMEKGQEKEIKLEPKDAYGDPNPQLVKKVPKDKLPQGQDPKPGMVLALGTPDGQQIPARITEVGDNDITIDLNHPLAGKTLTFKIKVV
ncbi:peptidylprolyl isomerase [Candidatus Woesearchaeota archaeon]|nr:peptidylprolyl isomerase [Candidatus Woesearchaeota archaeon]|tara:strand:- start:4554 stop:4970 length:417 start_codon:yes stop_codon:yes gene_type:complete